MSVLREHHWEGRENELFPRLPKGVGTRAAIAHVGHFLELARQRRSEQERGGDVPEELYLVDSDDSSIREVIGIRLAGQPLAMLGAVRFPRHAASPVAHGRPALAFFFSKPPSRLPTQKAAPPQGVIEVFFPYVDEPIPDMMQRLRRSPSLTGVHVDTSLVDYAFDLRFRNPSAIPKQGVSPEAPEHRVFRTTHGHVLSGVSVGLHKTLRKDLQFVTLTDVMQHTPQADYFLPTLALNRQLLAIETSAGLGKEGDAWKTLAFHPATARPTHLLGWPDELIPEGTRRG